MSRSLFLRNVAALLTAAPLILSGCASSVKTAHQDVPKEVIAGSAENAGFWRKFTTWLPTVPRKNLPEQKIQNPGKLHLAYDN